MSIQGGEGSWSEESLLAFLPYADVLRCATVDEAWRAVAEGRVHAAWLAASNTQVGDVPDTRAARARGRALASFAYPVRHALLAPAGVRLEDVARVDGHPLALAQCARTLARLLPDVAQRGTIDGAYAAWRLSPGERVAVVASAKLAARLGLDVLEKEVADDALNATTFELLVGEDDGDAVVRLSRST